MRFSKALQSVDIREIGRKLEELGFGTKKPACPFRNEETRTLWTPRCKGPVHGVRLDIFEITTGVMWEQMGVSTISLSICSATQNVDTPTAALDRTAQKTRKNVIERHHITIYNGRIQLTALEIRTFVAPERRVRIKVPTEHESITMRCPSEKIKPCIKVNSNVLRVTNWKNRHSAEGSRIRMAAISSLDSPGPATFKVLLIQRSRETNNKGKKTCTSNWQKSITK